MNMTVRTLDADMIEGCDTRCILLRYRDERDAVSPIYIRRLHSPEAHNEYTPPTDGCPDEMEYRGLRINFKTMTLAIDGLHRDPRDTKTWPTPIEWLMLRTLFQRFGTVVRHDDFLQAVWGDSYIESSHVLRVHMARLRRKLDPSDSGQDRFIVTLTGHGYRLGDTPKNRLLDLQNGVAVQ